MIIHFKSNWFTNSNKYYLPIMPVANGNTVLLQHVKINKEVEVTEEMSLAPNFTLKGD